MFTIYIIWALLAILFHNAGLNLWWVGGAVLLNEGVCALYMFLKWLVTR